MDSFAAAITEALAGENPCYIRLPLGWPGTQCAFDHPLDYLGFDGSGGIGSGPGMAVGAALALRDSGRMAVAVIGDGDYLMGVTALWTAVNQGIPLLLIVANNHSFFNDELHQDRIARIRSRCVENRGVGIRMDDPVLDLALMAQGQGAVGIGPVKSITELQSAITEAIGKVNGGAVAVVDVYVTCEYARGIPESVSRQKEGKE
jgi:thiamine pyrophosphate-dependent acetolactate synthase large subunit-like protein